jgi:hypothetical protein
MAWTVIAVLGATLGADRSRDPFTPIQDRRVRHRLRVLLADAPPAERWDQWLRQRADARRVWVHPGAVDRLADDDRVHPAAPALTTSGAGIAHGGARRFYVGESVVESVLADHRAQPDDDGQVVLMVVPPDVADSALGLPGEPVSPAAALVDLLGSSDARERYAATTTLEDARRTLVGAAAHGRSPG